MDFYDFKQACINAYDDANLIACEYFPLESPEQGYGTYHEVYVDDKKLKIIGLGFEREWDCMEADCDKDEWENYPDSNNPGKVIMRVGFEKPRYFAFMVEKIISLEDFLYL